MSGEFFMKALKNNDLRIKYSAIKIRKPIPPITKIKNKNPLCSFFKFLKWKKNLLGILADPSKANVENRTDTLIKVLTKPICSPVNIYGKSQRVFIMPNPIPR